MGKTQDMLKGFIDQILGDRAAGNEWESGSRASRGKVLTVTGRAQSSMQIAHFKFSSIGSSGSGAAASFPLPFFLPPKNSAGIAKGRSQ